MQSAGGGLEASAVLPSLQVMALGEMTAAGNQGLEPSFSSAPVHALSDYAQKMWCQEPHEEMHAELSIRCHY